MDGPNRAVARPARPSAQPSSASEALASLKPPTATVRELDADFDRAARRGSHRDRAADASRYDRVAIVAARTWPRCDVAGVVPEQEPDSFRFGRIP